MEKQNYDNHRFYYIPHHIVFYSLITILFTACVYGMSHTNENHLIWAILIGVVIMLGFLSFMLRQHYSLGNQNRIARAELRLRYFILTHKKFEENEQLLSPSQLLALRFSSDEELVELTRRAIDEKLTPDQIKSSIKNWTGDYMRV